MTASNHIYKLSAEKLEEMITTLEQWQKSDVVAVLVVVDSVQSTDNFKEKMSLRNCAIGCSDELALRLLQEAVLKFKITIKNKTLEN